MLSTWLHFQSRTLSHSCGPTPNPSPPPSTPGRHASGFTQGQHWPSCGQAAGTASKMDRWRFRHHHRKSGQGVPAVAGIGSRRGGRGTDLGSLLDEEPPLVPPTTPPAEELPKFAGDWPVFVVWRPRRQGGEAGRRLGVYFQRDRKRRSCFCRSNRRERLGWRGDWIRRFFISPAAGTIKRHRVTCC